MPWTSRYPISTRADISVARQLRQARIDAGLPQAHIPAELDGIYPGHGFTQTHISRIEAGMRQCGLGKLIQLCRVTGVDPIEMLRQAIIDGGGDLKSAGQITYERQGRSPNVMNIT